MDWNLMDDSFSPHACSSCNRCFPGPGPLNYHRRSCQPTKRRLQGALAKAKDLWEARKKSRRQTLEEQSDWGHTTDPDVAMQIEVSTLSAIGPLPLAFGSSIVPCGFAAEANLLPLPTASADALLPVDSADAVRGAFQVVVIYF
jgi:hypothetical protein